MVPDPKRGVSSAQKVVPAGSSSARHGVHVLRHCWPPWCPASVRQGSTAQLSDNRIAFNSRKNSGVNHSSFATSRPGDETSPNKCTQRSLAVVHRKEHRRITACPSKNCRFPRESEMPPSVAHSGHVNRKSGVVSSRLAETVCSTPLNARFRSPLRAPREQPA